MVNQYLSNHSNVQDFLEIPSFHFYLITRILKEEGNVVDGHHSTNQGKSWGKKCLRITLRQYKATNKMTFIKTKYQRGKASMA